MKAAAEELADEDSDGYDRVFLGGMSQGAFTSLAALMRQYEHFDNPLAGVFVLSGSVALRPEGASDSCHPLSLPPQVVGDQGEVMRNTPLFIWHGVLDEILPIWTNVLYLQLQRTYFMSGNLRWHWEPF